MRTHPLIAILACTALPSLARAETLEPMEPAPAPAVRTPLAWNDLILVLPSRWARTRVFAAPGVRLGSFTIDGDSTGTVMPFHLDLGVRRGRWLAFAAYDALGLTAGLAHRIGVAARFGVSRFVENDVGLEFWTEAGLGVEHVRWDAGGTLTRPDLALGIGATLLYVEGRRHAGITAGLRITLASPDRSFLFDLTVPFGT